MLTNWLQHVCSVPYICWASHTLWPNGSWEPAMTICGWSSQKAHLVLERKAVKPAFLSRAVKLVWVSQYSIICLFFQPIHITNILFRHQGTMFICTNEARKKFEIIPYSNLTALWLDGTVRVCFQHTLNDSRHNICCTGTRWCEGGYIDTAGFRLNKNTITDLIILSFTYWASLNDPNFGQ